MGRFKSIRALCLVSFAVTILGCGDADPTPSDRDGKMVYVDTDTGRALVADISTTAPAVHPDTGKNTLMPALYCPECEKWHPVPPAEQINRIPNAARCPKTGTPLTTQGPWPEM